MPAVSARIGCVIFIDDEANDIICIPTCTYRDPLTAHYRSFAATISHYNAQCPSKRGKRVAVVARDRREITLTAIKNQSDERTEIYDVHFIVKETRSRFEVF